MLFYNVAVLRVPHGARLLRECARGLYACANASDNVLTQRDVSARWVSSSSMTKTPQATASERKDVTHLSSLQERGLYNEDLFKSTKNYTIKQMDVSSDGRMVDIKWADGHISKFHAMWLRHNCHCQTCRLDHNGMVTIDFNTVDLDVKVLSAKMEGELVVVLQWQDNQDKVHEGIIPAAWLRQHCYSPSELQDRAEKRKMPFFQEKVIPQVEYQEIMDSDQGLYKWLNDLSNQGICLVKNVPAEKGMVAKMAERIAPVQHSVYGETFDVVSTPKPINAAYSSVHLALHMDQVHYEGPPGLQLLHCVEFDPNIIGGENTFADIHEIAQKFRRERPDLFDILARIPISHQTVHYNRDYPVHLKIQRPIFSLNHRDELVSVVWHPLMEGPLQVKPEDVEPFYKAYTEFFKLVNTYPSLYKLRMEKGDMISFNNRKVLHGRNSYSNQKGLRFLQGTYVEISEFQSRVQVFHNKLGDGRLAVRCGSFDWQ